VSEAVLPRRSSQRHGHVPEGRQKRKRLRQVHNHAPYRDHHRDITSVAGQNFTYPTYDSTDGKGTCNLAVSLYTCGDGGLATYASLYGVTNIAIDQSGNIYLDRWTRQRWRQLHPRDHRG